MIEPVLPIGTKLHDYEILKVLGIGGFGITYLAKHRKLGVNVAIKEYMPQEFSCRTSNLKVVSITSRNWNQESDRNDLFEFGLTRFLKEAKDLVRFDHPNIVRALNYFEANGTGYIVMDYVEGRTLKDWLTSINRKPNEEQLKAIFLPVLAGLGEVHRNGLLHRDIKPDNIYLRSNGGPLLLDFGTARDVVSRSNTVHVIVTRGYSPKEQYAVGSQQGPWTDIYSVGGTMYCCLEGIAPPGAMERSEALTSGKPDPYRKTISNHSAQYSHHFLQTIDQCLEFNASDRPQVVAEVIEGILGAGDTRIVVSKNYRPDELATENALGASDDTITHRQSETSREISHQRASEVNSLSLFQKRSLSAEKDVDIHYADLEWETSESSLSHPRKTKSQTPGRNTASLRRSGRLFYIASFFAVMMIGGYFLFKNILVSKSDEASVPNKLVSVNDEAYQNIRAEVSQINQLLKEKQTAIKEKQQQWIADNNSVAEELYNNGSLKEALILLESVAELQSDLLAKNPRQFLIGSGSLQIAQALEQCENARGIGNCAPNWFTVETAHNVQILPFQMDEVSVDFGRFLDFVESTNYTTQAERRGFSLQQTESLELVGLLGYSWLHPEGPGSNVKDYLSLPVTHVAYEDASAFCSHVGARLPSRAEWEYAARSASSRLFSDYFEPAKFMHKDANLGVGVLRSKPVSDPSLKDSQSGLYGTTANVWEWTSSRDTRHGDKPVRFVKGGSWNETVLSFVRLAALRSEFESDSHIDVGFRCARSLDVWTN